LVGRTETVMKTLNPTWRTFEVPMAKLTSGDPSAPLKFKVGGLFWAFRKGGEGEGGRSLLFFALLFLLPSCLGLAVSRIVILLLVL